MPKIALAQVPADVRLAIIINEQDRTPIKDFIDLLEVKLANLNGVNLLERSQIDLLLTEQMLSYVGTGNVSTSESIVKIGRLFPADILLIFEAIPGPIPFYRLRMMEAQTGIILKTIELSSFSVDKDVSVTLKTVQQAVTKHNMDLENRFFIGIMDVKSEEPGVTLDETAQRLRLYIESDIGKDPQIIILDREYLQHLQFEKNLAGLELQLKTSSIMIDIGLRHSPQKDKLQAEIAFRPLTGQTTEKYQLLIPKEDLLSMRNQLSKEIRLRVKGKETVETKDDLAYEAELFVNRVPLLLANGDYSYALRHAQAAYALMPDQSARYWVARSWFYLAWSESKNYFLQVSEKRPPDYDMTKRVLESLIQAYQMYYELTRHHINRFEKKEETGIKIPDPFETPLEQDQAGDLKIGFFKNYVQQGFEGRPFLFISEDQPDLQRLDNELREIELEINAEQREFYHRHFAENRQAQDLYWNIWQGRQMLMLRYGPTNAGTYPVFLKDFLGAYKSHNRGEPSIRIRGLWRIANKNGERSLSDPEKEVWRSLLKDDDVVLRLMARRQLMNDDKINASRELLAMFGQDLVYDDPVLAIADTTLWPEILRESVHVLALSNRSSMIEVTAPLIAEILEHKDRARLLGWRDIFWVYVNGLGLENETDRAKKTVNEAVSIFEQSPMTRLSPHDLRFRAELELYQVRTGLKKRFDPIWAKYFTFKDEPAFLGWHTDLEAPRPKDGELSAFGKEQEINKDVQSAPEWGSYTIEKQGRLSNSPWQEKPSAWEFLNLAAGDPYDLMRTASRILVDGTEIFNYQIKKNGLTSYSICAHSSNFGDDQLIQRDLGAITIQVSDLYLGHFLNAVLGKKYLLIATTGGLIVFSRDGKTKPVVYSQNNSLPSSIVTAAVEYDGKVYLAIGPSLEISIGADVPPGEKTGLMALDLSTGQVDLVASTAIMDPRHGLDGGEAYLVTSILLDEGRKCFWLSIAGDRKRNGIWRADLKWSSFERVVPENLSVQRMRLQNGRLLYAMYHTGIVMFDPDNGKKTWLTGYEMSNFTGLAAPVSPKGISGEPVYANPRTLLWPAAIVGENLLTLNWGVEGLVFHRQVKSESIRDIDAMTDEEGAVRDFFQNAKGVWIVTEAGYVYLLEPKKSKFSPVIESNK